MATAKPQSQGTDRLYDPASEQSVLGAILLKPDVLFEVSAMVEPRDFFHPGHRLIYQTMLDLAAAGQPVDLVTVTARLKDLGSLEKAGGPVFLAGLSEQVGIAANVLHYARRVRDKALVRNLREAALKIAATCEQPWLSAREVLDWAESLIYEKCHDGTASGTCVHLGELVEREAEVLAEIHATKQLPGHATGYLDLDRYCSWCPRDLVILAGRTGMGKTSLALNFGLRAATRGVKVGIISLEMSKEQISRRLLAIAGALDADRLNRVRLTAEEWVQLYDTVETLKQLPLWVDDTPGQTVLDIRSRARRSAARGDLDLLIVDYLQMVRPYRKGRSREEEVAETSRGLKALAGELNIPILAVAQLNRKLEERPDKRPKLSDLRECLPVSEWVDTPEGPVQLKSRPAQVISVDGQGACLADCDFIEKRYNRVFRVKTQFGSFCATARHPVLTGVGWKLVRDLVPGRDVVASPKRIPHANRGYLPHGRLLGWLLGNGYLKGTPNLIFRNELAAAVEAEVAQFGVSVNPRQTQKSGHVVTEAFLSNGLESGCLPNPIMEWLRSLGLEGKTAHNKFIPPQYLGSSDQTHMELLRGLMEADGTVTDGAAKYTTASELLARQVKWLFHTVGVRSTLNYYEKGHAVLWEVRCAVEDNQNLKTICGDRRRFGELATADPRYIDPAPAIFVELLAEVYRGSQRLQRKNNREFKLIGKTRMEQILSECPVSTILESPYMAMKNMGWGRIFAVEPVDKEVQVCDLHVPGPHCFLTNGLVVHNSGALEQDADLVLFLYRDEVYRDNSPDAGTAEVIIGKHRHGRVGTVKLAYQEHCLRFENLAEDEV